MSEVLDTDVRQLVISNTSFGPQEIQQIVSAIVADMSSYRTLRDAVNELETREDRTPATAVRLGVCYYLLGRYSLAVETLSESDSGALAHYYMGKSHFAQEEYARAQECFQAAAAAGYNHDDCQLSIAETQRYLGDPAAALATLDGLSGAVEQTAEYLYQRGATVAVLGVNPQEVVALYERAVDVDPNHAGALFGLAMENDRHGNDNLALELYERSTMQFPTSVGALLNLGLLYEDAERYDRAARCYQRVLDVCPSHSRARLFLKDARASGDMYYDDDERRRRDQYGQILDVPVTDFELSVRSRNCLQRMGIMTLGDLARTTEQELLASKNFGETSLVEIRDMLSSKGLRLGELSHERREVEPVFEPESLSDDERAVHDRPITDLNLSVRARKCMVRLGISSMGDLLRRTGDELLECKNFGVTSLNEVREKLTQQGLKLRGD
ncbi:MAG: tetratricopeptide repeat protein [Planctomycetota bacterium]|nr:MAG: tetratricopeptide repeat protein [Planctomycetota bacterium]REJ87969.1 MAG: tetratricopeptide repeat protein [Planctomycetota bacterium]REK23528.1 MAG: tetratricopeptide repeat protein [Planctomycetota bacterium]REK40415.1 MAG: tetratricopeptide repeat protein [Planctomycetota bacterium]